MALIAYAIVWVVSAIPLFFTPINSGGWLLAGMVCGIFTGFFGAGLVGASMLSDNVGPSYYVWWTVSLVMAIGGASLTTYCLAALLWRGAGLDIDVNVRQ